MATTVLGAAAVSCARCGATVPPNLRNCPGCNADAGFPNVRLAGSDSERRALQKRLNDAVISTTARKCEHVLDAFGREVLNSKVVIARSLALVQNLVESETALYIGYYKQLASGSRVPEDTKWERGRLATDSTVSPFFYEELVYGALSLDGIGVSHFGAYSIVLRESMINLRTTVFEENPFLFCQKHRVTAGQMAPLGYRALWAERDNLAKSKLHAQITPTNLAKDFPGILLSDTRDENADFIEAHVYGPIHRVAIEKVVGPRPKGGPQLVIWKSIERGLAKVGAKMEVT